jgi:antitoxin HicB
MTKNTVACSGSSFDDFLREEGFYEEVQAAAQKRVLSWMLSRYMADNRLSKAALARMMHTSRTQIDRILDPENTSITLQTVHRVASVMGKSATLVLEDRLPEASS